MEQLTLIIIERLMAEFPEFKWVDIEKQQMREDRPPVVFPCALVDVRMPSCIDMNDVNQQCTALVTISLCYAFTGDFTSSAFSKEERIASFEYLQSNRKVYEKFQGWETKKFNPFTRTGVDEPFKRAGYKITNTTFKTEFFDQSFEPLYLGDNLGNLITDNNGDLLQMNQI
jgi:hypothetical protein